MSSLSPKPKGKLWRQDLLAIDDLKNLLHQSSLAKVDKLLLVLASFSAPCSLAELRERGAHAGYRISVSSNPAASLLKSGGKAIRTSAGWELTALGKHYLESLGVKFGHAASRKVAHDLRAEATKISSSDTKAFIEEAISCFEHGLFRSAIVMSWLTAVQILKEYVHKHHLVAFNAEATRVNPKWKQAKTTDDIGRMDEAEFLDRLVAISVIGKNVKDELQECLKRRNGCGHPNSLKVRTNTVTHHIEILMVNVIQKFG